MCDSTCDRTMYWSGGGSIFKAEMDGSNLVKIVKDLGAPAGIAVDLGALHLFWVDHNTNTVQSSYLNGTSVQLVAQLRYVDKPWGVAVDGDRLFWGNYASKSIQTSDRTGQDVRTLYNGTHFIQHLTLGARNPAQTRQNHCEGQTCSGICVLTAKSFRCIP